MSYFEVFDRTMESEKLNVTPAFIFTPRVDVCFSKGVKK